MKYKPLILIALASFFSLSGCAVVWVADKTVDAVVFAAETTVKAAATAGDLVVPDDNDDEESNN